MKIHPHEKSVALFVRKHVHGPLVGFDTVRQVTYSPHESRPQVELRFRIFVSADLDERLFSFHQSFKPNEFARKFPPAFLLALETFKLGRKGLPSGHALPKPPVQVKAVENPQLPFPMEGAEQLKRPRRRSRDRWN